MGHRQLFSLASEKIHVSRLIGTPSLKMVGVAALTAKATATVGAMTVITSTTAAAATVMLTRTGMMPSMMKTTAMTTMTRQWRQ